MPLLAFLILIPFGAGPARSAEPGTGVSASGAPVGAILSLSPPNGAIVIKSDEDAAAKIEAAPPKATFWFEAGVHRMRSISPKDGQSFLGERGAVLNGAALLTRFEVHESYYTASNPGKNLNGGGLCDAGHPRCTRTQDVYFDGKPLAVAARLSGLSSGQVYFDDAASTIYLADDPSGHTVEIGVTPVAFNPTADHITIRNLVVEKYATPAQSGAIGGKIHVSDWIIDHVESRLNHGVGVMVPDSGMLRHSFVHDNGQMGVGSGTTSGARVQENDISRNNYAGYDCAWECGGLKFGLARSATIQGNNVHHNLGRGASGLWCDEDCTDVTVADNAVHDNPGAGIFYEISCNAVIRDNRVVNNGMVGSGWFWGGGIQIAASHHVEVHGNTVAHNLNGITGIQQNRGTGKNCGERVISHLNVHDNITSDRPDSYSIAGLVADGGSSQIFEVSSSNRFDRNTYRMSNPFADVFFWKSAMTSVQWKSAGNGPDGHFGSQ